MAATSNKCMLCYTTLVTFNLRPPVVGEIIFSWSFEPKVAHWKKGWIMRAADNWKYYCGQSWRLCCRLDCLSSSNNDLTCILYANNFVARILDYIFSWTAFSGVFSCMLLVRLFTQSRQPVTGSMLLIFTVSERRLPVRQILRQQIESFNTILLQLSHVSNERFCELS